MASFNWRGKLALITGASSGIGAATALKLAKQGLQTILVARRIERLQNLAGQINRQGGEAKILSADLTNETDRLGIYEMVASRYGVIDVLVNNAGLGWYGYYADMPWETAREMLQVNVEAVMHLTRLFLPGMQTRRRAHIINIGSIAGSFPNQGVVLYGASKSFLDSFTTSLFRELRGGDVHVSVVRAGPVASEFFEQAAHRPAGFRIPVERFAIPAEKVAQRIWGLLQRPKRVIYVPHVLRITPWVEMLFGWFVDRLGPLLLRHQTR